MIDDWIVFIHKKSTKKLNKQYKLFPRIGLESSKFFKNLLSIFRVIILAPAIQSKFQF